MRRYPGICILSAVLAIGASVTKAPARDRARSFQAPAAKTTALPLPGKPIEPKAEREEKPVGGWSGFYFGLNAGAASSETNR